MRKLQLEEPNIMRIAVQQEISRSEESRYDHRLHGILLVCQGMSCPEVAGLFGENARTVERWVNRFNSHGFAGLSEGERPGRPRRLTERQWAELENHLRQQPRTFGYEQNLWDGPLLSHHLRSQYGVELCVRQCQRMFRQLGFRLRKPRPLIAQGDPNAQRAYKKTSRSRSRRER